MSVLSKNQVFRWKIFLIFAYHPYYPASIYPQPNSSQTGPESDQCRKNTQLSWFLPLILLNWHHERFWSCKNFIPVIFLVNIDHVVGLGLRIRVVSRTRVRRTVLVLVCDWYVGQVRIPYPRDSLLKRLRITFLSKNNSEKQVSITNSKTHVLAFFTNTPEREIFKGGPPSVTSRSEKKNMFFFRLIGNNFVFDGLI